MTYRRSNNTFRGSSSRGSPSQRRVVAPSVSLSSRFQQVQANRQVSSPSKGRIAVSLNNNDRSGGINGRNNNNNNNNTSSRSRGRGGSIRKPLGGGTSGGGRRARSGRRFNRKKGFNAVFAATGGAMDIDQQSLPSSKSGNRFSKRGGRGGKFIRGRGGNRGGNRSGQRSAPLSQANLDMDLDNYMMSDTKAGTSLLDNDLDSYMQAANL